MVWSEYFYYDQSSPSGLRWKVTTTNNRRVAGDVAGTPDDRGYWIVQIHNKCYRAHRIIYELLVGEIAEGFCIDHVDRNPSNNCFVNLRKVSPRENAQNRSFNENNSSGKTGVARSEYERYNKTYSYWKAQWSGDGGKLTVKCFSILKYGEEEAFRLACEYRDKMIEELNEIHGMSYTETHGQKTAPEVINI